MFIGWGRFVVRARWFVLLAGLAVAAVGASWGTGVFGALSSGGFYSATSPSAQTRAEVSARLGPQDADVLALYSSGDRDVDAPGFRDPVVAALTRVAAQPQVASVISYYQLAPVDATAAAALVSRDRHATYAVVRLRAGGDDQKLADYRAIKGLFPAGAGITTQLGGARAFYDDANTRTRADIERAEAFSLPVLLVLLVIIFGSVVAASTPLIVGGLAILGGFVVVRLLTQVTSVSTFSINIITLIGLGLSIDYALFVVSRFREELAAGRDPAEAVVQTMATAGRTVAVSGSTITLALASLLFFPQGFLKSMGYGGMAAVAIAMLASLSVLPAGLAVLGRRINAARIRPPRPGLAVANPGFAADEPSTPSAGGADQRGAWAALARSVMRRPWLYLVGVLAVLATLAAPVFAIHFGGVDVRVLPPSVASRLVNDRIMSEFPVGTTAPIQVLATGVDQASATSVIDQVDAVPGVTSATVAAQRADAMLLDVSFAGGDPTSASARALVSRLRALPAPPGVHIGVTGYTADLTDQLASLGAVLPGMLAFVVGVTVLLLFLAFGSVILPFKAVAMNIVSLGAAFGAVVFIFQDGHFASLLGFTPTGFIEPTNPILMIAVLFGLATDYEVFLLSRVREEWEHQRATATPGPTATAAGADSAANARAVAIGLQRTGRIITSAALLLIVVVIGFGLGDISFVKMIGLGMVVAIVVDASLVRALLVPATMRLLGRWNWWAPGPLARLHRRYLPGSLTERDPVPDRPAGHTSVGR